MSVNKGIPFQNLVAAIERALLEANGAKLESPKRLRDSDTGRLREHDVVITWRQGHHEILTAIECRDTGRPVGVPAVEAFAKKCEKTGIHHPVIVSATGFTKTARSKAIALNVGCLELAQAARFPWMGMHFVVEDHRQFGHMNITIMCEQTMPTGEPTLLDVNDAVVSQDALIKTIANAVPFPENADELIDQCRPIRLHVRAPGWKAVGSLGDVHPISHFEVSTESTITRTFKPVAMHTYAGPAGPIEVVSSEITVGDFNGKLMFLKDSEDMKLVYVPEPKK